MRISFLYLGLSFLCTTSAFLPCKKKNITSLHASSFIDSEGYTVQSHTCLTKESNNEQFKPLLLNFNWYNFSKTEGLGLNISWGLHSSPTIGLLQGFKVIIKDRYHRSLDVKYFCLNCTLETSNITFYYDGFKEAKPETRYRVVISTIPGSNMTKKTIDIPSCHQNNVLKYSKACIYIAITKPYDCRNRSFEITYSIPSYYGSTASIKICEKRFLCYAVSRSIFPIQFNLPAKGVKNITLPKQLFLNRSYRLEVEGKWRRSNIDITSLLHSCVTYPVPTPVIIFSVLFSLALIITGIICMQAKWKISNVFVWLQCSSNQMFDILTPTFRAEHPMKLYLLFVNDHAKHREVVLKFASFLACDLNFEVFFELYEQEKVYSDSETWMENCICDSDKIIFVWSPCATERWSNGSVKNDMFTPVLNKVCNIHGNSSKTYKEKSFFVYFDYYDKSVLPNAIRSSFPCFQLMNKFEDLYFQLCGIQNGSKGNILRDERVSFDSYYNPAINSHGEALYASIQQAHKEVSE